MYSVERQTEIAGRERSKAQCPVVQPRTNRVQEIGTGAVSTKPTSIISSFSLLKTLIRTFKRLLCFT